jgi:hypothetical protein
MAHRLLTKSQFSVGMALASLGYSIEAFKWFAARLG